MSIENDYKAKMFEVLIIPYGIEMNAVKSKQTEAQTF